MRTKTEIYLDILYNGIIYIRLNAANHDYCFVTSDLLHNIPVTLQLSPDFDKRDLYFLNLEMPCYFGAADGKGLTPEPRLVHLAKELHGAVPDAMRTLLKPFPTVEQARIGSEQARAEVAAMIAAFRADAKNKGEASRIKTD